MNCLLSMNKSNRRCVFCTVSKTWQIGPPRFGVKTYIELIQSLVFEYIQLRLMNVWYYELSWKYVNTAKIISKVTITLSLILFWQCKVSLCVKLTFMGENCSSISAQRRAIEEPWFFFPALFLPIAVKTRNSHHFWSYNVTKSTREPTTRGWSSANI